MLRSRSARRRASRPRGRLTALALVIASILAGLTVIEWGIARVQPITTAYRWDAATGYRLRSDLDFRFATPEFATDIRTNAQGLRDPDWNPDEHRPVLLVLGDSFVFGHGVQADEALPARLQAALGSDTRIVNSGHPGWATTHELAFLRAEGPHYHPKAVVVGFVLNDVLANAGIFKFSPTATSWLRHLPFPAVATTLEYLFNDPLFVLFRLGLNVPYGAVNHLDCLRPGRCEEGWRETERVLAELAAEARRQGTPVLLVHLPTRPELVRDDGVAAYEPDLADHNLAAMAGRLGMAYAGLVRSRDLAGNGSFFSRDGHWTAAGHGIAALTLEPAVLAVLRQDGTPP